MRPTNLDDRTVLTTGPYSGPYKLDLRQPDGTQIALFSFPEPPACLRAKGPLPPSSRDARNLVGSTSPAAALQPVPPDAKK